MTLQCHQKPTPLMLIAHWFIKGLHGRHKPVPFIRWLQVNPHRVRWITIYTHRLSASGKCKSFKVIKQVGLSKHPSIMSLTLWNEDKKYILFVWSCTSWPPSPDLNWCSLLRGRTKSGRTSFIKELIAFAKLKMIIYLFWFYKGKRMVMIEWKYTFKRFICYHSNNHLSSSLPNIVSF